MMNDEMKPLRLRVAMLTGLIQMKKDLETDILEMKGQIEEIKENDSVRQTLEHNPTRLIPAPIDIPESHQAQRGRPKGSMTPAQRKAKSRMMKKRWREAKARGENNPFKPSNKQSVAKNGTGQRKRKTVSVPRSERLDTPRIGFGTNAEYIYDYAVAHGGSLYVKQAMRDALRDKIHNNLAYGVRLSVHLAELKRKGFLAKEKESGLYSLTALAHKVYQNERKAIQQ